ncbi:PEP-CTERM domain protein [Nitrosospira briensis]|uniref:PEP-CTERM domain protein n=1 Tax=Nitrosospira briensis TaxID=35799 RepID=UPI0009441F85|nr:PEP-CTERM domain protein [Nitrosospira briensis]
MKNVYPRMLFAALVASLSFTSLTQGASIGVLWYTYAHPDSRYRQDISWLSRIVHTLPRSKGMRWNLTFWDAGSAMPDLARFDVLVIESGEAFLTGPLNGPLAVPDYRGILNNRAAIEAARGDRTFITGADSDFHAIRGDTGNIPDDSGAPDGGGKCIPAMISPDCWDGALGHLVNAVNWAGSGNGLGIVSFLDGEHAGSFWWTHENSFLRGELDGKVDYADSEQAPTLDPLQARHPLNCGLTSPGLSDWDKSFHAFFLPVEGYTPIIGSSQNPGRAVAIATSVVPPPTEAEIYIMMMTDPDWADAVVLPQNPCLF